MYARKGKEITIQYSVPNLNSAFLIDYQNCAGEPYAVDLSKSALCMDEELVCCPKVVKDKPLVCDDNDGFQCTPTDVRIQKSKWQLFSVGMLKSFFYVFSNAAD